MVFGQLVILSDRAMHLMTSNPDHIPLVDIRQDYFHKSFELLIKFGLWPVVNSECWLWSTGWGLPTVLMSAATGCKLAKLDWNKIEHQNTFFQYFSHFYPISGIHWTLKMPYVFKHLEVYMKTWFLYYFINKWLHTILYHFNKIWVMAVVNRNQIFWVEDRMLQGNKKMSCY